MLDPLTLDLAVQLGALCVRSKIVVSGAESCTGGLIAAAITSVSGSSQWFDRGLVTYSNEAKMQMLGVNAKTLDVFGAVSEQTADEMARGVLTNSRATVSFSVTGVAGPTGGTAAKPVGMVCFGFATSSGVEVTTQHFDGDRTAVREQSVVFVLKKLTSMIDRHVLL
jgi:nicotinamide-nucleotide amidase